MISFKVLSLNTPTCWNQKVGGLFGLSSGATASFNDFFYLRGLKQYAEV